MILLDLDSPQTWHPHFNSFIYEKNTWNAIQAEISENQKAIDFMFDFKNRPQYQKHSLVKSLCETGIKVLTEKFTHVAGYHGCRPKTRSTYKKFGVLPSNIKKLTQQARLLFEGIPGFDVALGDIGKDYQEHNKGKIGFLLSATWAMSENNEYSKGSEFISAIANRLRSNAKTRFARTGKRTWIKCAIPISWLDTKTDHPIKESYVSNVISGLIRLKNWPEEKLDYFDQGFLLKKRIPPKNILGFISHKDLRQRK
jgi:hypothetical protein